MFKSRAVIHNVQIGKRTDDDKSTSSAPVVAPNNGLILRGVEDHELGQYINDMRWSERLESIARVRACLGRQGEGEMECVSQTMT